MMAGRLRKPTSRISITRTALVLAGLTTAALAPGPGTRAAPSKAQCRRKGCRFNARLWKCLCPKKRPRRVLRGGPMVRIPAGCFRMGYSGPAATGAEQPVHRVCLSAFSIDKYEVTVADYTACVKAGACAIGRYSHHRDRRCNYGAPGRLKHPINCVNWYKATAYCKWAGKRLPTEAEWEYAARGKQAGPYPWGSTAPTCRRTVMRKGRVFGCGRDTTWPVGSKPLGKSPFGLFDMSGNVFEWVKDCYDPWSYQTRTRRCRNPVGPCKRTKMRVMRGGSLVSTAKSLRSNKRNSLAPNAGVFSLGFRCAR